ncbi:MAG: DctP family TRAP transporter solute-binding subunit [Firmicutes bacterium]|nr:DctP family TRAP transporter solute-binding subunit [Bacillota bacterium]
MSRKKILIFSLVLMFVFSLALFGCGGETPADLDGPDEQEEQGGGDDSFADLPDIQMTLAHADIDDPTQHIQAASLAFKEYVEAESNGKIKVEISPGGALGNTEQLQEQTMTGEIEASTSHTEGTIAIVYPNIQTISVPYLFDSVDQALEVFRGEFGQEMFEEMRQQTGLRVIGVWDNGGFRNFTNSVRPIRKPEDMKGLKMRTMDIPAHMAIVEELGGTPTPVSWAEVYSALETGVVDGHDNSVPVIILGSIHEVQDYLILDGHVYTQQHLFINDEWFNSLPKAYQEIILRAGEKAGIAGERACRVYRDIGLKFLSDYMEIYEPTLEEIDAFRQATQEPVIKFIEEDVDDPAWIDKILKAAEEANRKLGYTK